jgi:hypothetical protein
MSRYIRRGLGWLREAVSRVRSTGTRAPKALVSSSPDIKIYLDNQPLDFSLSEDSLHYSIER